MPLDIVFAYGSLKRGFSNHHVIADSKFLGAGQTRVDFTMFDLGRYPGVIHGHSVIAGDVFAVPPRLMGRLDRLEDNGRVYQRKRTLIVMASGSVEAWIYLYLLARGAERTVTPRGGVVTWMESLARGP